MDEWSDETEGTATSFNQKIARRNEGRRKRKFWREPFTKPVFIFSVRTALCCDMSDEEWGEQEDDSGWGDAEFEEDDNAQEDSIKIQIENRFYEAEDTRRSQPARALQQFEECVSLCADAGKEFADKRFKALEHIVTILLLLNRHDDMLKRYRELLASAADVTRNEFSDSVNKVLNAVSDAAALPIVEQVYQVTLQQLKTMGTQERMWFNTNLRLCKSYMSSVATLDRAAVVLEELHNTCRDTNGIDDKAKGTQLLELYALKFQLYTERRDTVALKSLFARTKDLSSDINDPRSMSVIHECWGKLYGNDGQWNEAFGEFFQAFQQYQEIGHARARQCLKYVVIAGLLAQNQANPFDAQEAKVYERSPDIQAMVGIRSAYERGDIKAVEDILRVHHATVLDDAFIRQHLDEILMQIRAKALCDLIAPYRSIKLSHLANCLHVDVQIVQTLLTRLILDGKVVGKIDQIAGMLDLTNAYASVVMSFFLDCAIMIML
jgi:COP9 signalosome complex subunit 2